MLLVLHNSEVIGDAGSIASIELMIIFSISDLQNLDKSSLWSRDLDKSDGILH